MAMKFQQIDCRGTPYQVGYCHGQQGRRQVLGSIELYKRLFMESAGYEWNKTGVYKEANKFLSQWQGDKMYLDFIDEMRGIADGAQVHLLDIVGLNIRTEIVFGLANNNNNIETDGCTSMAWIDHEQNIGFLAQNWDWKETQKENLVTLRIHVEGKPQFVMVTEAGIIGKIGINQYGVGCCLNALKAPGVDETKLPVHLALRVVLESHTAQMAIQSLLTHGIASASNILIGDRRVGVSLESSCKSIKQIPLDPLTHQIFHTNNYLLDPAGVEEVAWLEDSQVRLDRIRELSQTVMNNKDATIESVGGLFKDEYNFPVGICRSDHANNIATLFGIVMDVVNLQVQITYGRPSSCDGVDLIDVKV